MKYMGGKHRIGREIARAINPVRGGRVVWEPFAGGLNVTPHLCDTGPVIAGDKHPGLTALYEYARRKDLPRSISEEYYAAARDLPEDSWLKAFIGFGCSFSGKYFGGYARGGGRNYAAESARSMERAARRCEGVEFVCLDFMEVAPGEIPCQVLYLDPPYRGTTGYSYPFDFDRFDENAVRWSKFADVFVSEYSLPYGSVVWERRSNVGLRSGINRQSRTHATEKLFWLPHAA